MSAETLSWKDKKEFWEIEWPANPAGYNAQEADGTKVGNPTSLDDQDKNNSVRPSIQKSFDLTAYKEQLVANTTALHSHKTDPEGEPAKWNPNAERQLAWNLEAGMNSIV